MKWVDCECGLPISVLIKQALVNTVNCLFQMSIMIRRPARHDRLLGTKRADAAGFEPFDRQHVSDKYPHADGEITDRLGAGISRRRAALKYRERHHEKMKKGINRILGDQPDTVSTNLSETVATEYVAPDPIFEDTASISGISQTSYAHTLLSGQDSMTIPSLPKDSANESPFECPYCYFIITIKNQRSWARHIFSNIMPYTCVYLNCSTPSRLYESRREWFCHLQNAHSVGIDPAAKQDCPLCKKIIASGVQFQKHLGRHLEELALFAMPRTAEDDDSQSSAYPFEQSHSDPMEVNEGIGDVSAEDYVSVGNFFLEGSILDERFEINLEEIQKQISYIRPSAADTKKKADHEAQAELGKWEERLLQKYTEQEAEEAIKGEDLTPLVQVKSVKVSGGPQNMYFHHAELFLMTDHRFIPTISTLQRRSGSSRWKLSSGRRKRKNARKITARSWNMYGPWQKSKKLKRGRERPR